MIDQLLVEPGTEARLRERSTDATFGLDKAHGKKQLADLHERLDIFQQRLDAEGTRSLLLVDRVGALVRRPSARNWVKALAVAQLLVAALERMDPQLPPPQPGIENVIVE